MTDKTDGLEVVANYDEVICPKCVHQFRAIPVNVQDRITQLEAVVAQAREVLDYLKDLNFCDDECITRYEVIEPALAAIDSVGVSKT